MIAWIASRRSIPPGGGQHVRFYSDVDLTATRNSAFVFDERTLSLPLRSRSYTKVEGTLDHVEALTLDGLGRIVYSGVRNGPLQTDDWIRGEYDPNGRRYRVSNAVTIATPTLDSPSSSSFSHWTTTEFDALGRIVKVTYPDGSFNTNSWSNNTVTTRDEVDNDVRLMTYDALERLTSVREGNPANGSLTSGFFDTSYGYDALDNLTSVSQTPQSRTFVYDSLSRMTSETQPESGTTTYAYDVNGNLTLRTDARAKSITRTYDNLDRLVTATYSDGTPGVSLTYDAGTNGLGQLTSATDHGGSLSLQYDAMGRVTGQTRIVLGKSITGAYQYNEGGYLTRADWPGTPGNQAIEYDHDSQGRQTVLRSISSGVPTAVVASHTFSHISAGGTATTVFAVNGTTEKTVFNQRLQASTRQVYRTTQPAFFLENMSYDFLQPGTGKINGNIWKVTDMLDSTKSMNLSYDRLNRLTQSQRQSGAWSVGYAYDRWGNCLSSTVLSGSPPSFVPQSAFTFSNNKVSGSGFTYDAAGNLTKGTRPETYQWDEASRLKSINGGTVSYRYDLQDRRVVKTVGGVSRLYFHEPTGEVAWEYPSTAATTPDIFRLYFNGKLIFENDVPGSGAHMVYSDHLGSSRIKASLSAPATTFCKDSFYPYGQMMSSLCDTHDLRFSGKERDSESGLDYFGARYYDSVLARFASPDPYRGSARPPDPQSWNRYAYVRNNPLRLVDPTGESWRDAVRGFVDGVTSAITYNANRLDASKQNKDFRIGRTIGDAVGTVLGVAEAYLGAGTVVGGAAVTVGTGGVGGVVGVPAAVAGGAAVLHGGSIAITGAANLGDNLGSLIFSESSGGQVPGTMVNPDGTPKDPEDQLKGITDYRDSGGLVDTMGKSEQFEGNRRRDMRGRSAQEVMEEYGDEPQDQRSSTTRPAVPKPPRG